MLPDYSVALKTLSLLSPLTHTHAMYPGPEPLTNHTRVPRNADIHGRRTAFLEEFHPVCERFHLSPLSLPKGASLPQLEILLYSSVFWKQNVQWENSCFVNIGSLCSLAQQALLCITHLRTEVLNNIFILPVDVSSLFGYNTVRF